MYILYDKGQTPGCLLEVKWRHDKEVTSLLAVLKWEWHNGEGACPFLLCWNGNNTMRRGWPSSSHWNSKNTMRRNIPLLDILKMRQKHNREEVCSSLPCQKRNNITRAIYPFLSCWNNKNAIRRGIPLPNTSKMRQRHNRGHALLKEEWHDKEGAYTSPCHVETAKTQWGGA